MRPILALVFAATIFTLPGAASAPAAARAPTLAQGEECTGENCPQPSGGRDCESKKENTIS